MPVSNTVFVSCRPRADTTGVGQADTGLQVRVVDRDYRTVLAYLYEFTSLTVSTELCGIGAGSVSVDVGSPFWSRLLTDGSPAAELLDRECLWQVFQDGVLVAEWLGTTVEENIVTTDGALTHTISGPGPAHVLSWAKVFPPGYPLEPTKVNWPFKAWTPAMDIFLYLLREAQRRDVIPFVEPMFTATRDSGGVLWPDVLDLFVAAQVYAPEMGSDLLTQLDIATGRDLDRHVGLRAEWVMWPGFRLDVRPFIGSRRDFDVVFYEANVHQLTRTRIRDSIANRVVVRNDYGTMSTASNWASAYKWGKREELQQRGTITDRGRRESIAQTLLAQRAFERSSWTMTVPYGSPGRQPFEDYQVGDWIAVVRTRLSMFPVVERFRVMAITVQVRAGDDQPTVELTLQDVFEQRQLELHKRLTRIINTVTNTTGGINTDVSPPETGVPVVWDPDAGWVPGSWPEGLGGNQVYVQVEQPAAANVGDLWYQLLPELG